MRCGGYRENELSRYSGLRRQSVVSADRGGAGPGRGGAEVESIDNSQTTLVKGRGCIRRAAQWQAADSQQPAASQPSPGGRQALARAGGRPRGLSRPGRPVLAARSEAATEIIRVLP